MAGDVYTEAEKAELLKYCTNTDRDVFALVNLPEVVKGTLFSRYSRSPKSLRRLLLDEFINGDEAVQASTKQQASGPSLEQALLKSEKFYERVLIEYGDDSVAELAGAHIALENISNLATKFFEDARIGISPLEKSTRYVYFNEKDQNGNYRFYRDGLIMGTEHADDYIEACNLLFDTYSSLMLPMQKYFQERFPRDDSTSDRAYDAAIRAKVCDTLRGLLPASTLTNVGLFGNGRALEYLISKARASGLGEVNSLGREMYNELCKVFPVFMRRAYSRHGDEAVQFYKSSRYPSFMGALKPLGGQEPVVLADYDKEGTEKVIAAILYLCSAVGMQKCLELARAMSDSEKRKVILDYAGNRTNRRHKPGRAFENSYYLFDITANFGAYRDLHRHRILTQERQLLTVMHGYDMPIDIIMAGYEAKFKEALDNAATVFWKLHSVSPVHAQYVVPFAYKIRWYIHMNLREAFHLIELRSSRQGHPDYRRIVQAMYKKIGQVHPLLAAAMKFVDMNDYGLERLEAERRKDQKLSGAGGGIEAAKMD